MNVCTGLAKGTPHFLIEEAETLFEEFNERKKKEMDFFKAIKAEKIDRITPKWANENIPPPIKINGVVPDIETDIPEFKEKKSPYLEILEARREFARNNPDYNKNIKFHVRCEGCITPIIHGLQRCTGCVYFLLNWKAEDRRKKKFPKNKSNIK